MSGWIGVDLDGTLAEYGGWVDETHIGERVPAMAFRVRKWLADDRKVKIFTARVSTNQGRAVSTVDTIRAAIQDWTEKHFGARLDVVRAGRAEYWAPSRRPTRLTSERDMSYCRWSCENYKSDVYVYADVSGGITCHVAGSRVVGEVPTVPDLMTAPAEEFVKAHRAQMAWLGMAKHAPIGLLYDGHHFNEADEMAMVSRLLELRECGYHVPEYAIEALREDAKESSDNGSSSQEPK